MQLALWSSPHSDALLVDFYAHNLLDMLINFNLTPLWFATKFEKRVVFANLHKLVIHVHVLMGMKIVHIWKTSILREGGEYHSSMTSVTQIAYPFHVWWCILWGARYVSHTIHLRTLYTIIGVIYRNQWGDHTIPMVQGISTMKQSIFHQ